MVSLMRLHYIALLSPFVFGDSDIDNSCRDSFGLFNQTVFRLWTCSLCYVYLFPKKNFVFNYYKMNPALTADRKQFYSPDIKVPKSLDVICDSLGPNDCGRWKSCCTAADNCCDQQIANHVDDDTVDGLCPQTWDGWSCFSYATPGRNVTKECPDFIEYGDLTGQAEKHCTKNGTWAVYAVKNNKEWTDYGQCVNIQGITGVVYAGAIASSFSLVLLIPATAIFFGFRQLRSQQRIQLHMCLFLSFILTSSLQLLWIIRVYRDRIANPWDNTFMVQNENICKIFYILKRYARCTNFFWMFCEGLFLHRLLVQAFKCPSSIKPYFLIGWGCPILPIMLYMLMRMLYSNETCWVKHAGGFEWIVYTPNLLCIVLNLLFLLGILRILLTQLHQHPNEPSNYRRALKATFVLVPLFGLQLFLVIYRPSGQNVQNIYEITSKLIVNSQGGIIALVFCYLNGEVVTCLKGIMRKLHVGKSNKGQSFATSYSVVTHKGQDGNEYIPMHEKVDGNANI